MSGEHPIAAAHPRYVKALSGLFAVLWIGLAIHPLDRRDWLVENAAVVLVLALVAVLRKRGFVLGTTAVTLFFVFSCLHLVGAHYTYAKVPYDAFCRSHLGFSPDETFGFARNQFDRLVHFLFGLFLAVPLREVLVQRGTRSDREARLLVVTIVAAVSALYEIGEWAATMVIAPDVGAAYLGLQGDEWDAQKDMALATVGAAITMAVGALIARRRDRHRESSAR